MRNREDKPYGRLVKKIVFRTAAMLVMSLAAVLALRSAGQGHIGNFITDMIGWFLKIPWEDAKHIYFMHIRSNITYLIVIAALVLFFALYINSFSWFTKYFDEITEGIDKLADNSGERIEMFPEMKYVEDRLNMVNAELKRRAEAEQDAEHRKNELIVYLAHDIKTPLTSVIGYLSLLNENKNMDREQRERYTEITLEKAFRLEKLINELFEITRYNMKNIPLKRENINLCFMFVQIIDEAYPLLKSRGRYVETDIDENLEIYADAEKMARVFNNLLKNAANYSTGEKIRIIASADLKITAVRFESEGEIPEDKLDKIFEKFYRLDSSRSTATGGSGLGLAIAKDIVELHSGNIKVANEDGMAVFTVTIPSESQEF